MSLVSDQGARGVVAPHVCHAHGCGKAVPPRMFACRGHWASVRPALQRAVWREYTEGQEVTKRVSLRYLAVQQRAVAELAFRPNDEKAAEQAMPYLLASEKFRRAAIDAGLGDPLQGVVRTPPLHIFEADTTTPSRAPLSGKGAR